MDVQIVGTEHLYSESFDGSAVRLPQPHLKTYCLLMNTTVDLLLMITRFHHNQDKASAGLTAGIMSLRFVYRTPVRSSLLASENGQE